MASVELPWPPSALSPNASTGKRIAKNKAAQQYKTACWSLARGKGLSRNCAHPVVTFHPPDGRRRDVDNMMAAFKSGLDGVALALGIDDRQWTGWTIRKGEKVKGGKVVLELPDNWQQIGDVAARIVEQKS